jgi:hypothetical protein
MSKNSNTTTDPGEPPVYQIRIKGHLGAQWSDWFEGLTLTLEVDGDTLLTGPLVDQAALHGLLKKVRDLGMPLISVIPVKGDHTDVTQSIQASDEKRRDTYESHCRHKIRISGCAAGSGRRQTDPQGP